MVVTEYAIPAPEGSGAVFAFVSDIHECDTKPALEALGKANADALLVGGDYVHNAQKCVKGFEFLRAAASLLPVFCSFGNHELRVDGICEKTAETGAVPLDNSDVLFRGFRIGGLTSGVFYEEQKTKKVTPPPDQRWLKEFSEKDGYKILLCHHPEYYEPYIKPLGIDLTLSGHAHGGQWRFFRRGLYAPGQGLFPKYTSGMYDGRLIVSRGLGNPHAVPRVNNAPEFIVLKIGNASG